mmetsp:Transcript_10921/g.13801  ORF Transcript_10921/g.13801 Transcript_10921/m.13801 type:complete len:405 (+) Transcript_10921:209-1423(+)
METTKEKIISSNRSSIRSSHKYPSLWEIDNAEVSNRPSQNMPSYITPGSEESFLWARSVSRSQLLSPQTTKKYSNPSKNAESSASANTAAGQYAIISLPIMISNTLVIAQEYSLSTLFLVAHRCMVCITDEEFYYEDDTTTCRPCRDESRILSSFTIFTVTLTSIAVWAMIARRKQLQRNSERIYYRAIDAIMIAGMLRFLSSMLRTLTASYSADTVIALAIGGMMLHVLSCDYTFANGGLHVAMQDKTNSDSTAVIDSHNNGKNSSCVDITYKHGRPLFMGGTISINCVFFSATLLASRCPSNSSSYTFLMCTVALFAYFPEARHMVAFTFGDKAVYCTFLILLGMCTSTYLLLDEGLETILFVSVLFTITCIAPTWRWLLQSKKEIICGPWDITHIDVTCEG